MKKIDFFLMDMTDENYGIELFKDLLNNLGEPCIHSARIRYSLTNPEKNLVYPFTLYYKGEDSDNEVWVANVTIGKGKGTDALVTLLNELGFELGENTISSLYREKELDITIYPRK